MGLIDIIMGSIIFIFIGGVIVYLLVFSMKSKRTKLLMAMLILLFIGYSYKVFLALYNHKNDILNIPRDETWVEYSEKACGNELGKFNLKMKNEDANPFLLERYTSDIYKTDIFSEAECFVLFLKTISKVRKKHVINIYDEETDQIIYRIEKLPTK